MRMATMVIGVVFIAGCDSSSAQPTPARRSAPFPPAPPVMATTIPRDIVSNIGSTAIAVQLDHAGRNVPDAVVQSIVASAQLRTYPGLVPVNFVSSVNASNTDETAPKQILLSPGAPLSNGWYLFSMPTLPADVAFASDTSPNLPQLGTALGRFSIGSSPVLRDVKLAANGTVVVEFSEGIVAEPGGVAALVMVTTSDPGVLATCTLMPTDFPNLSLQIGFKCPPLAWSTQHIHLSVSPGLATAGGIPLGVLRDRACAASPLRHPFSRDIDFSNAKACGKNCKEVSDFVEKATEPPTLTLSVAPECLWPPNHAMVLYTFSAGLTAVAAHRKSKEVSKSKSLAEAAT
jgi:hypothetical protein